MPERACQRCARPIPSGTRCPNCAATPRIRGHAGTVIRLGALRRAGWTCQGPDCGSTRQLYVDHVIPLSEGGSNDPSNLQVLCHDCHAAKTLAERLR